MNRLTKQIGLVLISSSLVLSGCAGHEDEIAERDGAFRGRDFVAPPGSNSSNLAERDDSSSGRDSAAPPGSSSGSSYPYRPTYAPGVQPFSNGGSRPATNSFSSFSGGSHSFSSFSGSSQGGSVRGGFGGSAQGGGS